MTTPSIEHLAEVDFGEKVLKAPLPVVLDFWATWCAPCLAIGKELASLAPAYEGKLIFFKYNIEDGAALPSQYGVRSVPTLLIFNNGKVANQKIGAVSKKELQALLDAASTLSR